MVAKDGAGELGRGLSKEGSMKTAKEPRLPPEAKGGPPGEWLVQTQILDTSFCQWLDGGWGGGTNDVSEKWWVPTPGQGNGIGWKHGVQKKKKKDAITIIISPSNALHIYYYYYIITTTIT